MKLKKFFALALAAATLALALTACGSKADDSADSSDANTDNQSAETVTVKLGVVGGIYDDLWASAKAALADEGIDLEIVQFSDYVTPNNALANGDIDLNAFQHRIYLQNEIDNYGYAIQNIGNTFIIPLNLYSQKVSSVDELKDGDVVAIPDDLTNGGRALKVLEAAGLIELDPNAAFNPTVDDITSYKVNITIEELKANTIPSVLPDARPVLETMDGWQCDISGVRNWEDLPEAARKYVEYVEQAIGCHITYVSVGPERDSIIIR